MLWIKLCGLMRKVKNSLKVGTAKDNLPRKEDGPSYAESLPVATHTHEVSLRNF